MTAGTNLENHPVYSDLQERGCNGFVHPPMRGARQCLPYGDLDVEKLVGGMECRWVWEMTVGDCRSGGGAEVLQLW